MRKLTYNMILEIGFSLLVFLLSTKWIMLSSFLFLDWFIFFQTLSAWLCVQFTVSLLDLNIPRIVVFVTFIEESSGLLQY